MSHTHEITYPYYYVPIQIQLFAVIIDSDGGDAMRSCDAGDAMSRLPIVAVFDFVAVDQHWWY